MALIISPEVTTIGTDATNGTSGAFIIQGNTSGVGVTKSGNTLTVGLSAVPNASLANSSITINGQSVSLGGSTTISAAAANALTAGTGISYNTGTTYDGSAAITISNSGILTVSGTTNQISASTTTGATTLSLPNSIITPGDLTVSGNLVVNGTTTTVNSSTITVDDKNIELGSVVSGVVSTTGTVGSITGTGPWTATITGMTSTSGLVVGSAISATNGTGQLFGGTPTSVLVASIVSATSITYTVTGGLTPVAGAVSNIITTGPTDVTANGGGLTLKGATDKTIIWDSANTNWTSSEHWNLPTGKTYKINNVTVLSATQVLGKNIGGTTAGDIVSIDATQTLTNKTLGGFPLFSFANLNATGTNQAGAAAITTSIVNVTTSVNNTGVVLPVAAAGVRVVVRNTGTLALNLYPNGTNQINALAASTAFVLAVGAMTELVATSTTQWYTMTAIYG